MSELSDALKELGVTAKSAYNGEDETDGWKHDTWTVTLTYQDRVIHVPFKTGLGHRKEPVKGWGAKPVPPDVAAVVSCLISDSSACSQSFADWCNDYGYDADSRKQLDAYLACQVNGDKLRHLGLPADVLTLEH